MIFEYEGGLMHSNDRMVFCCFMPVYFLTDSCLQYPITVLGYHSKIALSNDSTLESATCVHNNGD